MWRLVNRTDIRVLLHAQLEFTQENKQHWDKFLHELVNCLKDSQTATLVKQINNYFTMHPHLPFLRMNVHSIVIPRSQYHKVQCLLSLTLPFLHSFRSYPILAYYVHLLQRELSLHSSFNRRKKITLKWILSAIQ